MGQLTWLDMAIWILRQHICGELPKCLQVGTPEALKAQAIAARSYAYRYKTEGKQICTTEACQVFRKSKADNPPPEWRQAVIDTRGHS